MQPATASPEQPAVHPRGMLLASVIGGALNRASGTGGLAAVAAGFVVALALPDSAPWLTELGVAGAAGAVTGIAVTLVLVPRQVRRAFESFAWLGRREMTRFRERTGARVPTTPDAMATWLAAWPPTRPVGTARVELLAMLGRTDEARAELAALGAPASALEEVEQAGVEAFVGFIETGDPSDARLREAASRLDPASPEGLEAAVAIAIGEARAGLDRGDPAWAGPLLAVRPRLGGAALRTTVRDFWVRTAARCAAMGAIAAVIVGLGQLVLDGVARFAAAG